MTNIHFNWKLPYLTWIIETKSIPEKIYGNSEMFHFAEINQAPSSYSVQQYIGRVLTPKLVPKDCVRYLETTWEERDWSKNLYEVLSKKIKERGFRKTWHVFSLNSLFLMFGICQMVLCLMSYVLGYLLIALILKEPWIVKVCRDIMDFYH